MKFVYTVSKSIIFEDIGDVYVVGGFGLCGYSVIEGVGSDILVIY